jgi:hypothetical protein
LDIQYLPAIAGGHGFEYKYSAIHLRTRRKYSEIHLEQTSAIAADFLERARNCLPPFHLVVTDNAWLFTMEKTPHKERTTAFEKRAAALGIKHFRIAPRSPWQNGFIERSNRTDNDECFHIHTFASSEERRLVHRLWEMSYNETRPHQGLGGQTPASVFDRDYPLHAAFTRNPMAFRRTTGQA